MRKSLIPLLASLVALSAPLGALEAIKDQAWSDKAVFASDGEKVGYVGKVIPDEKDGLPEVIFIPGVGGFLKIGTRCVAIPKDKFTRAGDHVQLGMTGYEVSKLPADPRCK